MKKPLLLSGLLALVLSAGGGAFYLYEQSVHAAEVFAAAIPATPDLAGWPAPIRQRFQATERKLAESPVEGLAELSRLYHANGFLAEAVQCYSGLEQLQPNEPRWFHLHATILAGYGENDPALLLWKRTVGLAPDYVPAHLRIGDVYVRKADFSAATQVYRDILKDHPDEPYAKLGLARCEFEAGHWDRARQILEPLVAQTNYTLGYDLIVTAYERLGMDEPARAIRGRMRHSSAYRDPIDPWCEALADDCYDVYALTHASGAAERNRDFDLAFRRINQALALDPSRATTYFQLGKLYQHLKEYAKARENLERCIQLDPAFPDAWAMLAALLETVGNRAAADQAMMDGLKHCPMASGLLQQNAERLVRDGHMEESLPLYREAIRYAPNSADPYVAMTVVLMRLGRKQEAVETLESALRAEPDHPGVLASLAYIAVNDHDEPTARKWILQLQNQPRVREGNLPQILAAYRAQFGRDFR